MGFKEIASKAQGALKHHQVGLVFINLKEEIFLPKDAQNASDGFGKPVYTFDGTSLRRIGHKELFKLPRSIDGRGYKGIGAELYKAAPATGDRPADPPATGDSPATGDKPGDSPATGDKPGDAPATGHKPGDAPATGHKPGDPPATGEKPKKRH